MNVKQFAKLEGYENAKFIDKWNGYKVYQPIADTAQTNNGYPLVILVKNKKYRMSTSDEAIKYLDFQLKKSSALPNKYNA